MILDDAFIALKRQGLYFVCARGAGNCGLFFLSQRVQPLADKIKKQFHKSKKYKARRQREKIEKAHQQAKKEFGEQYGVNPDEYDYCYNIFGELMEKEYLEQIIRQYEQRKGPHRSYRELWSSNYGGGGSSSYSILSASTYGERETDILRGFYKKLLKIYHPDLTPAQTPRRRCSC